jgi:hypothetical protein
MLAADKAFLNAELITDLLRLRERELSYLIWHYNQASRSCSYTPACMLLIFACASPDRRRRLGAHRFGRTVRHNGAGACDAWRRLGRCAAGVESQVAARACSCFPRRTHPALRYNPIIVGAIHLLRDKRDGS